MSHENVEVVRRMYSAFHEGDFDGALSHFDPNVLVDASKARPDDVASGTGHGRVIQIVTSWVGAWDEWREEIEEVRDLGSSVLVLSVQRGRGKGSGAEVEARWAVVYELDRGVITSMRIYPHSEEGLKAAGLRGRAMSQENVDLVRALTEAGNRVDIDAVVALLASDVVWEENAELPGLREVYRGRSEVRAWAAEILEIFESPHQELDRITELSGDRVFTENVLTAHGKGSGLPTELRYWALYWIKEGKIARRQVFWNREEALASAGLTE
jgi:ketosteroid isomerase-like protein